MEGKGPRTPLASVIFMGLLILTVAVAQNLKPKSCCINTTGRNCYNVCRLPETPRDVCAKLCGCVFEDDRVCKPPYLSAIHPNNYDDGEEASTTDYCKLGCASSVCETMSTLHISGISHEPVKEAAERCNNACSEFCTKGSNMAMVTA